VLLNLAGNAIKFTSEGRVTIRARHEPLGDGTHKMRFEVEDTGVGIAPDKQTEIFDAFTQGDNSTNRRFGGSGLGLAISKRLVTAMGGSIGVKSEPGEGSCFWFEVTLGAGEAVRVAPNAGSPAEAPEPRRILLVEDVELNREIIRSMLERDGHEVAVAENGREAVRMVRGSTFDMVFMDIHMPVMDGIEATRLIRKFPPPKCDIPIIALTANVMAPEQQKCRQAGMNDVLMKPVDWDRVRACLGAVRPATPPVRQLPFDAAIFDKVADVMPPARLATHVAALAAAVEQLAAASAQDDRQVLEAAAHKIVSQAGMVGLQRLSDRAARLEQACRGGDGLQSALEAFRQAAGDVCLIGEATPVRATQRSC
jgi:CheY-like chemotaxis protein